MKPSPNKQTKKKKGNKEKQKQIIRKKYNNVQACLQHRKTKKLSSDHETLKQQTDEKDNS